MQKKRNRRGASRGGFDPSLPFRQRREPWSSGYRRLRFSLGLRTAPAEKRYGWTHPEEERDQPKQSGSRRGKRNDAGNQSARGVLGGNRTFCQWGKFADFGNAAVSIRGVTGVGVSHAPPPFPPWRVPQGSPRPWGHGPASRDPRPARVSVRRRFLHAANAPGRRGNGPLDSAARVPMGSFVQP